MQLTESSRRKPIRTHEWEIEQPRANDTKSSRSSQKEELDLVEIHVVAFHKKFVKMQRGIFFICLRDESGRWASYTMHEYKEIFQKNIAELELSTRV